MTYGHGRDQHKGVALVHMAVFMTMLLLFTGLAVDSGRAYLVKAQLTKAVDGAALGAARNLNSGNPEGRSGAHLQRQLPLGLHGHDARDRPGDRRRLLRDAHRSRRPASTSSPSRRRPTCRPRSCGSATSTR